MERGFDGDATLLFRVAWHDHTAIRSYAGSEKQAVERAYRAARRQTVTFSMLKTRSEPRGSVLRGDGASLGVANCCVRPPRSHRPGSTHGILPASVRFRELVH